MALMMMPIKADQLSGHRILIAEDEFLIALEIASVLEDAGARVFGPCETLAKAMAVAQHEDLTGATLDVRLGPTTTEVLATILFARGIPFGFYTGNSLPPEMKAKWPDHPVLIKPADETALLTMVASLSRRYLQTADIAK